MFCQRNNHGIKLFLVSRVSSFCVASLSRVAMSDARAFPAPLEPVVEESRPAATAAAGPGPSVGPSYDDVSYTARYPSHGSGGNNDTTTYYCLPPQHQWPPTPAGLPYSPAQSYHPYQPYIAAPYHPLAPPFFTGRLWVPRMMMSQTLLATYHTRL
jgi:hypothetical protein